MRRADVAAIVAYAGAVGAVAVIGSSFWLFLATSALITATVAMSVGIIYDSAGLLSLCQMTFAGIGAWTIGWLARETDLPFLVMLVAAALVPAFIGVVVGLPALRLRGQNLAVFTLVFSAAVSRVIFADGFPGLIEGNRVSPPTFISGDRGYFLFCAVILGLLALVVRQFRRAPVGRWWFVVRRSERATAALGRSVVRTKLSAFATSAAISGVAGGMLVAQNGIVSGASFEPLTSMTILTSALMFGAGNFEGALLAGVFGQLIPEVLDRLGLPNDIAPMVFAVGGLIALAQGDGGLSAAIRAAVAKRRGSTQPTGVEEEVEGGLVLRHDAGRGELLLDVQGAGVSYGAVKALDDVDLTIEGGSFVGLIGPNGAGKSTFVDLVSGFITDHQGTVSLDGTDVTTLSPRHRAKRGLRRSFQQGHTPQDLTVGGYLELASGTRGSAIADTVAYFSLPPLGTPIHTLDVGTRRILEVCGAVAAGPKLLLLDEPAAGLSGHDRALFLKALSEVPARTGSALLLIEHDLEAVAALCDSVVVLDFGRVIARGTPDEVLNDTAVVDAYIGAAG